MSWTSYLLLRDAFILGIGVQSDAARTAGTLTVKPTVGGTELGYSAVLDGTNTLQNITRIPRELAVFAPAGSVIGAKITTDGSWAPTTANVQVVVFLEYTMED